MANEPAVNTMSHALCLFHLQAGLDSLRGSENEFVLRFGVEIERKEYGKPRVMDFSRKYILAKEATPG